MCLYKVSLDIERNSEDTPSTRPSRNYLIDPGDCGKIIREQVAISKAYDLANKEFPGCYICCYTIQKLKDKKSYKSYNGCVFGSFGFEKQPLEKAEEIKNEIDLSSIKEETFTDIYTNFEYQLSRNKDVNAVQYSNYIEPENQLLIDKLVIKLCEKYNPDFIDSHFKFRLIGENDLTYIHFMVVLQAQTVDGLQKYKD